MVISQGIYLSESFKIKLPETVLCKLEDGLKQKKELLLTIDASHYGMRNGNWTLYRHDTVCNDINSFVSPSPKPIIERHRPKESDVFGHVIAADYKLTDYHNILLQDNEIETLTTEEYIAFCKDQILPLQKRDRNFNGLAYVQVTGRLNHEEGIKKVLDQEFLSVSIGAIPRKLICSECGQDQVKGVCSHYGTKSNNTFMLAEQLQYEELSFVRKGADPFGKVVRIHDGLKEEMTYELEDAFVESNVEAMFMADFFKETEGKTIVCMNNICTVINQEENVMANEKSTLSLKDEFAADKIQSVTDSLGEVTGCLDLPEGLTDKQFGLVQKTSEGLKRRFPLHDELNVRLADKLLAEADDLTDLEKDKVKAAIKKAAKKLNIEIKDEAPAATEEPVVTDPVVEKVEDGQEPPATEEPPAATEPEKRTFVQILDELKEMVPTYNPESVELQDSFGAISVESDDEPKVDPVARLFDMLRWFANDIKWAGESLMNSMTSYLVDLGKDVISKDELQETASKVEALEAETAKLKDELESTEQEMALLDEQNRELNYQLRGALVDEIVSNRDAMGMLEDSADAEKAKFFKFNYDALVTYVNDTRKLKLKLKDGVNNNLEIKTITDPTHQDSLDGIDGNQEPVTLEDGTQEETPRVISFEEQVAVMKSLLRTRRY